MTRESDREFSEPVSRRYRELGAEEPPRALDEAILAASRRAARPWTQRWAVPLSLAAVLVLSVTVTLRIQHEQPGIESPATAPKEVASVPPAPAQETPLKLKAENKLKPVIAQPEREQREQQEKLAVKDESKPAVRIEPKPFATEPRELGRAAAGASADALSSRSDVLRGPAESGATGAITRQAEERTSRDAEAAARAPQVGPVQALAKRAEPARAAASAPPAAKAVAETPERELERIAELRRQEKHDEADKALAEFRKRYPDYKIPEAMLERVEKR